MSHQFFGQPLTLSAQVNAFERFAPKMYDLRIKPNAFCEGTPVETNKAGIVIAYTNEAGCQIRNNFKYLFFHTNESSWLMDSNENFHPVD